SAADAHVQSDLVTSGVAIIASVRRTIKAGANEPIGRWDTDPTAGAPDAGCVEESHDDRDDRSALQRRSAGRAPVRPDPGRTRAAQRLHRRAPRPVPGL